MKYSNKIKHSSLLLLFTLCFFVSSSPLFATTIALTPEEKEWLSEHKRIKVSGPQAFPPL